MLVGYTKRMKGKTFTFTESCISTVSKAGYAWKFYLISS